MFQRETLVECPFCGANEDKLEMLKLNTGEQYYVKCSSCGSRGGYAETERNARVLWNFRYIPPMQGFPVLRIEKEELEKKVDEVDD